MESVATSVSALAGLLSAIAGLITALRRDRTTAPADAAAAASAGSPVAGVARPARPLVHGNWTAAGYGMLALLMAVVLVLLVGVSGAPPDHGPLIWLRLAVAIPFALAAYFGVSDLYGALKHGHRDLLISSGAGLVAAASALATMVIASSYQSTGSY